MSQRPAGPGALSHIRVLDLSRILAGPWCSQNLADMGAEVIKVERPGAGDDTRGWGPPWVEGTDGEHRDSTYYAAANRGKRSITLDIARPEGQAMVRQLAAISDVVIENYKIGDLKRYGLDYASLAPLNPGLVYCSITGLRAGRTFRSQARIRLRVPGRRRPDEHHRRARRPARRWPAEGGASRSPMS